MLLWVLLRVLSHRIACLVTILLIIFETTFVQLFCIFIDFQDDVIINLTSFRYGFGVVPLLHGRISTVVQLHEALSTSRSLLSLACSILSCILLMSLSGSLPISICLWRVAEERMHLSLVESSLS